MRNAGIVGGPAWTSHRSLAIGDAIPQRRLAEDPDPFTAALDDDADPTRPIPQGAERVASISFLDSNSM